MAHATAAEVFNDPVTSTHETTKPSSRVFLVRGFGFDERITAVVLDSCLHDPTPSASKPPNIMVDPEANDAVKLLDFGIAIREGAEDACFETGLLGTPAYMAPEQVDGNGCGKAADLYALGALALELLTGKPPYDYPSLHRVLAAVLREEPEMPSARGLDVPGLDAVFERALARDPKARFGTGSELLEALTQVLQGPPADRSGSVPVTPSVREVASTLTDAQSRRYLRGAIA